MTDLLRQHLGRRLAELFEQQRVVVWEDDSGTLEALLRENLPAGVEMPRFEGNPLSLRQAIDDEDPWLERRWLLYVSALPDRVESDWLADYEQGFYHLPQENLARALSQFFEVEDSAEMRRLLKGPAALRLAMEFHRYFGEEVSALTQEDVVFGLLRAALGIPELDEADLVLRFLVSGEAEERWKSAGLLPALTAIIKSKKRLGLRRHLVDGRPPEHGPLARCLVASALVESGAAKAEALANHLPEPGLRPKWRKALESGLNDPGQRARLIEVITEQVQESALIEALRDPLTLASGPALPLIDDKIQRLLVSSIPGPEGPVPEWWDTVATVASGRLRHPGLDGPTRESWESLRAAATLLAQTRRRMSELQEYPTSCFERLVTEYAKAEGGAWEIDALYRRVAQGGKSLLAECRETLIVPAREAYHRWTREVTRRLVLAVATQRQYGFPGVLRQTQFWREFADVPGRVAFLMVDALRADLAHELGQDLRSAGRKVEFRTALAELPTRTEVGMAALLPRADDGFSVRVEQGKLVSFIASTRLPGVRERTTYLELVAAQQGREISRRPVGDFLDRDSLASCLRSGLTPVAYTTDLDDAGEIAAGVTFRVFDEILETCARYVDCALQAGFSEVVVGADHGFLVRDPQAAMGGVPGTEGAAGSLARGLRYAAGSGTVSPELVRLSADILGRGGDDIYTPRDTTCLAVQGGPSLFVHGGLSLQESVLVFLRALPGERGAAALELIPVKVVPPDRATSLTFKLMIVGGAVRHPLLAAARSVRVQIEDAQGRPAVAHNLEIKPSTSEQSVPLMVTVPAGGSYSACLYDATKEVPFMRVPFQVEVLGDEFGF